VILDFVARRDGYWGDNADTHFAGAPSGELAKLRSLVWDTLRWAIEQVKPGVVARELDQAVRARIRAAGYPPYPHHTGHGLGVSYHEEPRIVPYNPLPLAPEMVVALEPGVYLPGVGGVRLEHVVRVTADGCEILTRHLPH
jgi:Xaa-Pro aminopeptidase